MPGLSQLKKLSEDVVRLGNEPKLRAERGEKPIFAVIPSSIQDIDDSEDFVLGMPQQNSDNLQDGESLSENSDFSLENNPFNNSDFSKDEVNNAAKELESLLAGKPPMPQSVDVPDLSNLLNPLSQNDDSIPDLSAFEEPAAPSKKQEPSIGDMSLDDLLSSPAENLGEPELLGDLESFDEGSLEVPTEETFQPEMSANEIPVENIQEETDAFSDFDDFNSNGQIIDMGEDLPAELREVDESKSIKSNEANISNNDVSNESDVSIEENPSIEPLSQGEIEEPADFQMTSMDFSEDLASNDSIQTDEIPTFGGFGFAAIDTSGLDDFGSAPTGSDAESAATSEPDFSALNFGDAPADYQDSGENSTPEVFDTSEMDGINFDNSASQMADFNIPDTDSQLSGGSDTDFELDLDSTGEPDFEIAGYTGPSANPFDEKGRIKSQLPDKAESKEKNSLTDEEYKKFKKNLKCYPLNVRIAIEDLIVKNEFTDDAIFEVIEKVLKKVTARQLATHLEKMLDIQLPIPKDFERRTVEEYEAYKASFQYQLKNRIVPVAIVSIFLLMIGFCSVYLGSEYVVKPIRAEILYKQGYSLIENDEYPQSEILFNKALELKQKKKWFFKYAQAYRAHKQYDRAELMYKNILARFNHDKFGGLEYAQMELEDLANYVAAETIVKREILDYHVNDTDAILLLGDIYLEWATEEDPSKFELAYEQYSILMQLPDTPKCVDARMMIYNVRTDNLKGVLTYKEMFYPEEKSLTGSEWTQMSGYLMDKLYGNLAASEEYLRASIEDVYSMLVRAIKFSPESPISRYNMARYYINSGSHEKATEELGKTIKLFENAQRLKKRDLYKYINTYRLLGEQHLYNRDYILAQETFSNGIDLFEDKNSSSGFESNQEIGIMYSDMADIDYFISGDLENALRNYTNSVNNKNDTSSIRYRIGFIKYSKENYDDAFKDFLIASNQEHDDKNLLLALGNSLSLKQDDFSSVGYYQRLLDFIELEINKKDVVLPQVNEDDTALIDLYMKVSNNIGVGQFRIAQETGDSSLNGKSLNNFQNSLKAWDTLTRNPVSMVRLGGTNLAEQNIRYVAHPMPAFEPAIYTDIPRILQGEKALE